MSKEQLSELNVDSTQERMITADVLEISDSLTEFRYKMMGKTLVVSGGAGFLGSWFCEVGLELGAKIICIDNLVASTEQNIINLESKPNFRFINDDIAKVKIPNGADYVVHMASIASPPLYQARPIDTLNAAILGSINLLEYSKENNILGYILASTSEVYGNPPYNKIPTKESYLGNVNSYGARSMYDESKRVEEAYCYAYRNYVPIRIARIFNTFGPRIDVQHPLRYGRALIKFINQALNEQPITVCGDGSITRSFCYVSDQIVGLYKLLLTDNIDGEVVNIGNDKEVSIKKLAEKIKKISHSNSEIKYNSQPKYDMENDPRRRKPDISKARKLLDFNPEISLEDGLRRTIEWTRAGLI